MVNRVKVARACSRKLFESHSNKRVGPKKLVSIQGTWKESSKFYKTDLADNLASLKVSRKQSSLLTFGRMKGGS